MQIESAYLLSVITVQLSCNGFQITIYFSIIL